MRAETDKKGFLDSASGTQCKKSPIFAYSRRSVSAAEEEMSIRENASHGVMLQSLASSRSRVRHVQCTKVKNCAYPRRVNQITPSQANPLATSHPTKSEKHNNDLYGSWVGWLAGWLGATARTGRC